MWIAVLSCWQIHHIPKAEANLSAFLDDRPPSSAKLFPAFQRLSPYFHRNVSYGSCEDEVICGCQCIDILRVASPISHSLV